MDGERERGRPRNTERSKSRKKCKSWFEKRMHTIEQNGKCPDDSYEKHPATSVDGNKTGLKFE